MPNLYGKGTLYRVKAGFIVGILCSCGNLRFFRLLVKIGYQGRYSLEKKKKKMLVNFVGFSMIFL